MKVGQIEGTPEEIRDFTQNHGLNMGNLIQIPNQEEKLATRWIVFPASLTLISVATLATLSLGAPLHLLVFLLGIASAVWLCVSTYIRWGRGPSAIVAVGIILVLFTAAGYIAPKEALDAARDMKN